MLVRKVLEKDYMLNPSACDCESNKTWTIDE